MSYITEPADKNIYYMHKAKFFANEAYYTSGAVLHVLSMQLGLDKHKQSLDEFTLYSSFMTNLGMGFSHFKEFFERALKIKRISTYNKQLAEDTTAIRNRLYQYYMYEALTKLMKYYDRAFKALEFKFSEHENLDIILKMNLEAGKDPKIVLFKEFIKQIEVVKNTSLTDMPTLIKNEKVIELLNSFIDNLGKIENRKLTVKEFVSVMLELTYSIINRIN